MSSVGYSQNRFEIKALPITILNQDSKLSVSGKTNSSITIHNQFAATKESRKKKIIDFKSITISTPISITEVEGVKKMSFNISDINNDPQHYKYAVLDEKNKTQYTTDLYWGIEIKFKTKLSNEINYVRWVFNNDAWKTVNGYGQVFAGAKKSFKQSGYTYPNGHYDLGWKELSWNLPEKMYINFIKNRLGGSHLFVGFDSYDVDGLHIEDVVQNVISIELLVGPGAKLCVYDLKIETETQYAKFADTIDKGDAEMKSGNYMQAANYYSQAIDKGYKNYDIYMKRANAYFNACFYNNTVLDATSALSYQQKPEAYLLRGKAKLNKEDLSGFDDLKKGGPEGEAIWREIQGY